MAVCLQMCSAIIVSQAIRQGVVVIMVSVEEGYEIGSHSRTMLFKRESCYNCTGRSKNTRYYFPLCGSVKHISNGMTQSQNLLQDPKVSVIWVSAADMGLVSPGYIVEWLG